MTDLGTNDEGPGTKDQPPPAADVRTALNALSALPGPDEAPALKQLGELPIGKTRYPVRGVMATVYDTLAGIEPQDD